MGSRSVARFDIPAFTLAKPVLDLATIPLECKAELTKLAGYIPKWCTRPKTVTHPSTERARHKLNGSLLLLGFVGA